MTENEISAIIPDAAIEVHRTIGEPGSLESRYEESLAIELSLRGLKVKRQMPLPVTYKKGVTLADPLRLDLLIQDKVIVECKATRHYNEIFEIQTLTYLRIAKLRLGLVINFGDRLVKDGFHRVFNDLN